MGATPRGTYHGDAPLLTLPPNDLYIMAVRFCLQGSAMIETTYTKARTNLARLLDEVAENRETVMIRRRTGEAVAMIAASELSSLTETAHLLSSPRNAERLLAAMERAKAGEGVIMTADQLRGDLGLGPTK
jgi:antitoxin YefM